MSHTLSYQLSLVGQLKGGVFICICSDVKKRHRSDSIKIFIAKKFARA
jgi:hypothetical protein